MKSSLAFLLLCFAFSLPSFAAETPETVTAPPAINIYLQKMDKKFDKGMINFTAGWTELLRKPVVYFHKDQKGNRYLRSLGGLGVGASEAVAYTAGGFFNALTSILPQWEVPLPEGGIQPENF